MLPRMMVTHPTPDSKHHSPCGRGSVQIHSPDVKKPSAEPTFTCTACGSGESLRSRSCSVKGTPEVALGGYTAATDSTAGRKSTAGSGSLVSTSPSAASCDWSRRIRRGGQHHLQHVTTPGNPTVLPHLRLSLGNTR